jgi:hypothetical protein
MWGVRDGGVRDEGGSAGPQRMQACLKKLGTALDGAHRAVFVPAPRVTWHHSRRAAAASYSYSGAVTVAPASYDASEDSMRYTALMSSSSVHAASYLTGQAVLRNNKKRLSERGWESNAQVVVGARVGFVFLLELLLHGSHVVRCSHASRFTCPCGSSSSRALPRVPSQPPNRCPWLPTCAAQC